jgi:two-component system LytT family response regulator
MINCIAVDDEPLALSLLKDYISKVPFLNLVAECGDAFEAMKALQENKVDLIFIDIQMPGLTGMQFISSLAKKPLVVFITAYKNYAVESYDLAVVDYLLKPVALDRFIKSCERAKEIFELKANSKIALNIKADHFFVNLDYSQVKIKYDDLIYIKSDGDYIKIYLKSAKTPLLIRSNLKAVSFELPTNQFIRIHKSYLLAMKEITAIRKNSVFIQDKEFPIGETFRNNIEKLTH